MTYFCSKVQDAPTSAGKPIYLLYTFCEAGRDTPNDGPLSVKVCYCYRLAMVLVCVCVIFSIMCKG